MVHGPMEGAPLPPRDGMAIAEIEAGIGVTRPLVSSTIVANARRAGEPPPPFPPPRIYKYKTENQTPVTFRIG